jgi:hypothetical protein
MPLRTLTKAEIITALARLAELAQAEGVRLEMTLYGGAVMMLAYDARDMTKDVDAIVHPPEVARRLVARVAVERGLHDEWLNDDVKQFVSTMEAKNELPLEGVSGAGLRITKPTAKYLLAMKVMAARLPLPGHPGDFDDIKVLLRLTRLQTVDRVEQVVNLFFPDTVLPKPTRVVLTSILTQLSNEPTAKSSVKPATKRPRRGASIDID